MEKKTDIAIFASLVTAFIILIIVIIILVI